MAIATAATDIVSLALMKEELGIPEEAIEKDAAITAQIEAATAWAAEKTSKPILKTDGEHRAMGFPRYGAPIRIPYRYLLEENLAVEYWTPETEPWAAADGSLSGDTLGRLESRYERGFMLYPHGGAWPEAHPEAPVVIRFRMAWDLPGAIRQAVILQVRDFFEGQRESPRISAAETILQPYVTYGTLL
ncbi:MAG: hypothetical protein OXB91_07415 [Bryobacterales bacterium]|nr:hypothetical protein [Bryobacterales bacterium]